MTELLERASFLQTLAEYADEARRGEGRLVLVSGESGIGKTVLGTVLTAFEVNGYAFRFPPLTAAEIVCFGETVQSIRTEYSQLSYPPGFPPR